MGIIHKPDKVKLITSIFSNRKELFNRVISILQRDFGPLDFESGFLSFDKTDYYTDEMGKGLLRKFYSFKRLIEPDEIVDIKLYTNRIEDRFREEGRRKINIDPGYISLGKLVLATTKDQQHRIYLNKGIYAETTLRYKDGRFMDWEWTYPDYRTAEYRDIFNKIRDIYREQIR